MAERSAVPAEFASATGPTERQLAFLDSLLDERELADATHTIEELKVRARELTVKGASSWIERLLELPKKTGAPVTWPEVPAGRYALEDPADELNPVKFYQVDRPAKGKWEGYTFLSRFVSDERFPIKQPEHKFRVLEAIAADPAAASARFGHETNHCGICGRRLTREESRERGIGPVCAGKAGW